MASPPLRSLVDASEMVRLRWVAVAGQGLAIGLATVSGQPGPWWALLALVAVGAASNLALTASRRSVGEPVLAGLLFLDVILLTGMLHLTGGALSPFTPLYLVFPVLGALILQPPLAWAAFGIVLASHGALVVGSFTWDQVEPFLDVQAMHTHVFGLYAAVGVGSPFLVSIILRTRRVLASADAELAEARELEHRNARLASLATLAAGAAHELATPLGTIAVTATELARETRDRPELQQDVSLIQSEVARCRQVLQELSADVGAGSAESVLSVPLGDLVDLIVHDRPALDLVLNEEHEELLVTCPPRLVAQAVRRLVGNAFDASNGKPVRLEIDVDGAFVRYLVVDEGEGMTPEVLARATEPFFSTKDVGRGMGLGLWFVRSVAAHLGGELSLDSTPGVGTRASLRLPAVVSPSRPATSQSSPQARSVP